MRTKEHATETATSATASFRHLNCRGVMSRRSARSYHVRVWERSAMTYPSYPIISKCLTRAYYEAVKDSFHDGDYIARALAHEMK